MITFVDPKAVEQFNCSICLDLFEEAVQIQCEGHVFCKSCITPLISSNTIQCPICRRICDAKTIHNVRFVDRQIKNLEVRCPNFELTVAKLKYVKDKQPTPTPQNEDDTQSNTNSNGLRRSKRLQQKNTKKLTGKKRKTRSYDDDSNHSKKMKLNYKELCDWTGAYSDLQNHVRTCALHMIKCKFCDTSMLHRELTLHYDECSNFPLTCDECQKPNIKRDTMQTHVENECPMTWITCSQNCGFDIQRRNVENHITNDCDETVINCAFHTFGCSEKFKRKELQNHFAKKEFIYSHLASIGNKQLKSERGVKNLYEICHKITEFMNKQSQSYNDLLKSVESKMKDLKGENQRLNGTIRQQQEHITALHNRMSRLESVFNVNSAPVMNRRNNGRPIRHV